MFGRNVERVLRAVLHGYRARCCGPLFKSLDSKTQQLIVADAKSHPGFEEAEQQGVGTVACLEGLLYRSALFRSVFYYRCSRCETLGTVGRILLNRCMKMLPPNPSVEINAASIGGGLRLLHGSVVIGSAVLGQNVRIGAGVVIGYRHGGTPTIHDDVHVCSNATVIGAIDVGEGAVIGAGAVVLNDVPAYAVAVGNPARIVDGGQVAEALHRKAAEDFEVMD